jgi:hypothetical protein
MDRLDRIAAIKHFQQKLASGKPVGHCLGVRKCDYRKGCGLALFAGRAIACPNAAPPDIFVGPANIVKAD